MRTDRLRELFWAIVGATAVFIVVWLALHSSSVTAASVNSLNRPEDPVVVAGADLAAFDGDLLGELKLYAFDGSNWSPIPFQFDERLNDITGTYVISEDGLLDANDELVFMGKDVGQQAGVDDWPSDTQAQANPRVMVTVNDPLHPGDMGWAYLYRSTTLATDPTSYVDWDQTLQTVTALSYTASFTSDFIGISDLTVNGNGVDILDRQKTRVTAFIITLDEEDLATLLTPTVTIPVVGPVRGVANGGDFNISIYGARLDSEVTFDTSVLPIAVDDLRNSLDLNDPNVTGITNYFNSNGAAVPIDGVNDTVNASPSIDWFQASGASGGIVVAFPTVNVGGGTVTNYYKDDSAIDSNDTGDQRSYGDSGLFITNPSAVINFSLVTFILPPNTTTNVGADYFDRISSPLTSTTTTQIFGQGNLIYMPFVIKP
ncbi:MAG: hypothetical protein WAM60_05260 [Candidatus Promineifilaceae bacterium]